MTVFSVKELFDVNGPGKGTGPCSLTAGAAEDGAATGGGAAGTGGNSSPEGGGGGSAPTPGLTMKECLHLGHFILAPCAGTRESSKLYFASQLGQTIRILTSAHVKQLFLCATQRCIYYVF
jgi:hypothetical protein